MTRVHTLAVVALLGAGLLVTARSAAGPDKIAFPASFKSGVLYSYNCALHPNRGANPR